MKTYFFDDQRLYGRINVTRKYENPELIASFSDGRLSTDLRASFVFRKDGKYYLLYQGTEKETHRLFFAMAESDDGVNFTYVRDIMDVTGCEIADICEDVNAPSDERYKMLLTKINIEKLYVDGTVWVSGDLINWNQIEADPWNGGCEPITGIFRNNVLDCYTIIRRPFWGERRLGHTDTKDFRHFTPFEHCLQIDSLDKPLEEMYGMPVLPLDGIFVGFPLIYGENESSHGGKFNPGTISPQLAYSFDGHHWQRSLRESYLREYRGQPSMFWVSAFSESPDGNQFIYVTHSKHAHGEGFALADGGTTDIYKTPKDRFICLASEEGETGTVTTRENYFTGRDVFVNIKAEEATFAVFESVSTPEDMNLMGMTHPVPGFTHEDCVPFSGDSTAWKPEFREHDLSELSGRTLSFEIRFRSGKIFTVSGDFVPVINTVGSRIRSGKVDLL